MPFAKTPHMLTFFHICFILQSFPVLSPSQTLDDSCLFSSLCVCVYIIHIYSHLLLLDWESIAHMMPISLKYFCVYFLKSRIFSYIAIVQLSKLNWYDTITYSVDLIHILPEVSRMSFTAKEYPELCIGFSCTVSLVCFNLE